MKICFTSSFPLKGRGAGIFVRNLSKFLNGKGVDVTFDVRERCDILFVVISAHPEVIERKKRSGVKIIQRLDGVFFDKSEDYESQNLPLRRTQEEANFIVYQSKFSKEMCHLYLGKPSAPFKIIYNPVDIQKFTPHGERIGFQASHMLLAVSIWRPHKRLQDSLEAFKELLKLRGDLCFFIIGSGIRKFSTPTIKSFGSIPNSNLPSYYRAASVLLHPSWLDWCPNVVLESLASGTPVVCSDTGGAKEIVGEGGVVIDTGYTFDYKPKELYKLDKIPKINPVKFSKAINMILENKENYSRKAREHCVKNFSLEIIGEKYYHIFKEVLEYG
jgi:glycosyltransferase involved in cell wall biosynthesis